MLAREIENWTGWRPRISDARRLPGGSHFIYIGNATEDSRLGAALGSAGLRLPPGFPSQGYALAVDRDRILIGGASAQGAFYGVQTLRQLLRPQPVPENGPQRVEKNGLYCPAVTIRDWPAMSWRGVSIDVSRGPIPKLAFLEEQIRVLSGYKINLYALYMENTFTLPGQPIFAPSRDALTTAELRQLVAYGKKYFVTLMPELETFGHLHNVLRHDVYSQLAEVPHGAVLTPTQPASFALIGQMLARVAVLFPGPLFHIGADETFELGRGQTKQLVTQEGLGRVYLDTIAKVDAMLGPYHKQTLFWADIAEQFPKLLPLLPKDIVPVIWTYGPKASYASDLAPFRGAGLSIFVSPGVSNWRLIYPDFGKAFVNIRNLTRDGQTYHALGMLNTEWKDFGEELGGLDWPGFVFGAACSWQPGAASAEEFRQSYDWAFYRNSDHTFEAILDNLAAANTLLDGENLGGARQVYFWESPFSRSGAKDAEAAAPVTKELRIDAEQAWESLLANAGKAKLHAGTLKDLVFAARRLDALGMRWEYTEEMSHLYWDAYWNMNDPRRVQDDLLGISSMNGRLADLRREATELRAAYTERWHAENRPYSLGTVLVRYDTQASALQEKILKIDALRRAFPDARQLPAPESLGFFLKPAPERRGE